MIKNVIQYLVDGTGQYLSLPVEEIVANDNNTTRLQLVCPFPLENSVSVHFTMFDSLNKDLKQYLIPSNKKGGQVVDKDNLFYQQVNDWNVFEIDISQKALSYISKYRAGRVGVSFKIVERVPNIDATNYVGLFGIDKSLPQYANFGDYVVCDTFNYLLDGNLYNKGDILYYTEFWRQGGVLEKINTETEDLSVSGSLSVPQPEYDENEIGLALAEMMSLISHKQDINDDSLDTETKTVSGAINEVNRKSNTAFLNSASALQKAEEAKDIAEGIDAKATQALANAIDAVASANTAFSASNTALSTANTAITTANTALSSANSAVETAEDALDTAESADTKADTAISTANGAKTTAEGIDAKSTTALSNSQSAVSTANTAETKAQEALDQVVYGLGTKVYRDTTLLSSLDIKPIEDNIAEKAPLANPTFTGSVIVPTTPSGPSSAVAKSYVDGALSNPSILVNGDFVRNDSGTATWTSNVYPCVNKWGLTLGSGVTGSYTAATKTLKNNIFETGGKYIYLYQYIDNPTRLNGKTVTLSIKAKSTTGYFLGQLWHTIDGATTSVLMTVVNRTLFKSATYTFPEGTFSAGDTLRFLFQTYGETVLDYAKLEIGSLATAYTPEQINNGHIRPEIDNSLDLGSATYKWKDLYLSGKLYNGTYNYSMPTKSGTLATTEYVDNAIQTAIQNSWGGSY